MRTLLAILALAVAVPAYAAQPGVVRLKPVQVRKCGKDGKCVTKKLAAPKAAKESRR